LEYEPTEYIMFNNIGMSKTILYIAEGNASNFVNITNEDYTRYFTINLTTLNIKSN
jgi:hypothetical protein